MAGYDNVGNVGYVWVSYGQVIPADLAFLSKSLCLKQCFKTNARIRKNFSHLC